MLGLTPFGAFHTAIGLAAVVAGIIALVRDQEISPRNRVGKTYVIMTILTCLTGFGIFHHGGFGRPHALGIITLVVLGIAVGAEKFRLFGAASRAIEIVSYSATFFFHMIPAVTETATRLPVGAPLASSPEAPEIQRVIAALFLVFVVGASLQVWRLLRSARLHA